MSKKESNNTNSPLKSHYSEIHSECEKIIEETFEYDTDGKQPEAYNFAEDLSIWLEVLEDRTESELIERSINEYRQSLVALAQGSYRHAFMTLRLHFELILNAIYLSGYEKRLREWKEGKRNTKWRNITDKKDGLLSKSFAQAFNKPLKDKVLKYRNISRKVYRETSRFVHGNLDTEIDIPNSVVFDPDSYDYWHEKADTMRVSVIFSLCLRYIQDMRKEDRYNVSDCVRDYTGHISEIRSQLP